MMCYYRLFLLLALSSYVVESRHLKGNSYELSKFHHSGTNATIEPKRWAVLVAGSNSFINYRHQVKTFTVSIYHLYSLLTQQFVCNNTWKYTLQADICHAYQILKNGGLEDDNIIVFMYDDIAFDVENSRPGVIINQPNGDNVYKGVPKVYFFFPSFLFFLQNSFNIFLLVYMIGLHRGRCKCGQFICCNTWEQNWSSGWKWKSCGERSKWSYFHILCWSWRPWHTWLVALKITLPRFDKNIRHEI